MRCTGFEHLPVPSSPEVHYPTYYGSQLPLLSLLCKHPGVQDVHRGQSSVSSVPLHLIFFWGRFSLNSELTISARSSGHRDPGILQPPVPSAGITGRAAVSGDPVWVLTFARRSLYSQSHPPVCPLFPSHSETLCWTKIVVYCFQIFLFKELDAVTYYFICYPKS